MAEKIAPTLQEAIDTASVSYTDRETVAFVQRALLSKGYVDGGPADGILSQKTKDEILTFRARNNLQLIPVIDKELLACLEVASDKALPVEQVTATKAEVASKVEIVNVAEKVSNLSWWGQFWAWFTGIPAGLFTLLAAIVGQIDSATAMIQPIKNLLFGVEGIPPWVWIAMILAVAIIFAVQQMKIARLAKELETRTVDGYQRGTIKNDLPPKEEEV